MLKNRKNKKTLEVECVSIDQTKDIERFRLAIWVAKMFTFLIIFMVVLFVISFTYISFTTKEMAGMENLNNMFTEIIQIIKVILAS